MAALPPLPDNRPAVLRALGAIGAFESDCTGVTIGEVAARAGLDAGATWLASYQLQYIGLVGKTGTALTPSLWSLTPEGVAFLSTFPRSQKEIEMADQASADPWIGKFVVVRTTQAGVHAGRLVSHDGQTAELAESRRLWYWKVANKGAFLSGVATEGLDHNASKVGAPIDIRLTDVCEVIPCNDTAAENITAAPTYEAR